MQNTCCEQRMLCLQKLTRILLVRSNLKEVHIQVPSWSSGSGCIVNIETCLQNDFDTLTFFFPDRLKSYFLLDVNQWCEPRHVVGNCLFMSEQMQPEAFKVRLYFAKWLKKWHFHVPPPCSLLRLRGSSAVCSHSTKFALLGFFAVFILDKLFYNAVKQLCA